MLEESHKKHIYKYRGRIYNKAYKLRNEMVWRLSVILVLSLEPKNVNKMGKANEKLF